MINRIISICLRKRLVVIMVAILLAVFGYYSWTKMAVEAYPDIGDVTAQVVNPGAGTGRRGSGATDHDSAWSGRWPARPALSQHAFEQHVRSVAHHD